MLTAVAAAPWHQTLDFGRRRPKSDDAMPRFSASCSELEDDLEPHISLDEAGILLGMSDHAAWKLERSAWDKIMSWAATTGARCYDSFMRIEGPSETGEGSYGDSAYETEEGWVPITQVSSGLPPNHDAIDLALAFMFLKRSVGALYRPSITQVADGRLGYVEAVVRWRNRHLLRTSRRVARAIARDEMPTVACVSYVDGTDRQGPYSVPLLSGVLVLRRPQGFTAP